MLNTFRSILKISYRMTQLNRLSRMVESISKALGEKLPPCSYTPT